jgi:hypothetical protein
MAGSAMVFTEITHGTIKKVKAAWTSDSVTGAVTGTTTNPYDGRIIGACTVPGAGGAAPDPNYDIAVNDNDSVDIALGALANRHTSDTEYVAEASMAGVAHSKLTVSIAAAGNSNTGVLYLYIR